MVYEYNEENGLIKVNNDTIWLTDRENIIFKALWESNILKPVSMEKLNDLLNNGYMFRENTIAASVGRLRKKLKDNFDIECISGRGYIMKPNKQSSMFNPIDTIEEGYDDDY